MSKEGCKERSRKAIERKKWKYHTNIKILISWFGVVIRKFSLMDEDVMDKKNKSKIIKLQFWFLILYIIALIKFYTWLNFPII